MEGDGSVGAVASNGDAEELGKGGDGQILNAGFQIGFQVVEDNGV